MPLQRLLTMMVTIVVTNFPSVNRRPLAARCPAPPTLLRPVMQQLQVVVQQEE